MTTRTKADPSVHEQSVKEQSLTDQPDLDVNPKTAPAGDVPSNTVKDPDNWTTGGETMTGAQASYLQTLCEEAGTAFDPTLSKADASKMIDALQAKTGRGRNH